MKQRQSVIVSPYWFSGGRIGYPRAGGLRGDVVDAFSVGGNERYRAHPPGKSKYGAIVG